MADRVKRAGDLGHQAAARATTRAGLYPEQDKRQTDHMEAALARLGLRMMIMLLSRVSVHLRAQ
jgi:hypothetical protein